MGNINKKSKCNRYDQDVMMQCRMYREDNQIQNNLFKYPEFEFDAFEYEPEYKIQKQAIIEFNTLFSGNNETYKIQDQAITQFNTLFSGYNLNYMQQSSTNSMTSSFQNYSKSIETLQEISNQNMISQYELVPFSYQIARGGQGNVKLNFANFKQQIQLNQLNQQNYLLPIATKNFQDRDQFIRESIILSKLQGNLKPEIVFIDKKTYQINMEMCICTLDAFNDYIHKNQLQNDDLFSQILIDLMKKIQIILNQGLFHGDIKPSNIAISLRNKQADFIFIDFGASSWDKSDYYNYYTPAFSDPKAFQLINTGVVLNEDQIRFSELYSICRTVQFLMINSKDSDLFQTQNVKEFIHKYSEIYSVSIQIMKHFLLYQSYKTSSSQFNDILSFYNKFQKDPVQINVQHLYQTKSIFHQF